MIEKARVIEMDLIVEIITKFSSVTVMGLLKWENKLLFFFSKYGAALHNN